MTIQLLFFDGCPNSEPAFILIESVLGELGVNAEIERIAVGSEREATEYRFLGSPTIQVNGQDIEPSRRSDDPAYGCRLYVSTGRQEGIPPREMLRTAIRKAMNV